jgi:hypothetical protein
MSAPIFVAAMLAVLSQRAEVLGGVAGSLSGRPGDAAYPVQS